MIHHFRQHSNHATCEEWIYNTSQGADHNRRCPTHQSLGGRHLLNHSRGMGVTFLVSICAAHSAAGVAMHPTPVPLNQACLPTKHSTRLPISANLRHSRITHLGQTLWHHPFLPAFLFPSLSSLTFWSLPPISHLSLTTEPSLNCFWAPPILWLLPLQGPPTCSGQDCGGSPSKC